MDASGNQKQEEPESTAKKAGQQVFPKPDLFPVKIYNKIEDNYHLSNKKALFINMKNYYEAVGEDPFLSLPVTFHVKEGLNDPEFTRFKQFYDNF